ncbi:DUF3991 domain-containing protein [Roseomonas nepalensis]|uniref:DUF3991 domain-containing protein n=1 Tax=Muricoccus nepalensis TaxID=1854500 RepID=A0A502F9E8_9PROT|nr:DUF3991 and TOPRIM domain-containing protein [Roseomonas nepalensis]TPG45989.1 DUF3991 domain-containing protein [Roseomonas nepalensis]
MADPELESFKREICCTRVLEQHGYIRDVGESTDASAKYRKADDIVVVQLADGHGTGWMSVRGDGGRGGRCGDVISLWQDLTGDSLGRARVALRRWTGGGAAVNRIRRPASPPRLRPTPTAFDRGVWGRQARLCEGSLGWAYLTEARGLNEALIKRAIERLREGPYGTVWFLHADPRTPGVPTGWERRGPSFDGYAKGGGKALFFPWQSLGAGRLVLCESAIDALSYAQVDGCRGDTLYASHAGAIAEETWGILTDLASGLDLVLASDRDVAGDNFVASLSERLGSIARSITEDRVPPYAGFKDWNEFVKNQRLQQMHGEQRDAQ